MAATHHSTTSDYRGYSLRAGVDMDMEAGGGHHQHRFSPAPEPTCRPLLFGTLAVMGLLQVASSVAILLHLTGYLQEVDLSTASHRPIEEVHTEPVWNALRDEKQKKNRRCKPSRDMPSAHLPIKAHQDFTIGEQRATTIAWDEVHGLRHRMGYEKGKLLVMEAGFYYVYAKTCFRYYKFGQEDVGNIQLMQYVYLDSIRQNGKASSLMKTGSTKHWDNVTYHMYCAQQGQGVRLEVGDALFVEVSSAWILDQAADGTYFGALKLSN